MDIRMVRRRGSRVWLWVGTLAALSLLVWAGSTFVFGDATTRSAERAVGADARFGADRAPVQPMDAEPFASVLPLETRELGRLVRLTGYPESRVRDGAVWVRAAGSRRILVRFEPEPPQGALSGVFPGAQIDVEGYVQRMSRAEFDTWMDTLGVVLPRPRQQQGGKFGDVPDSLFARVDSLFIRNFYVSVRPWGLQPGARPAGVTVDTAARPEDAAAGAAAEDGAAGAT
jgi:hypothetical protein